MSTSWKVGGSVPGYSSLHAEVSLGKIPNRELPPMYQSECVCVHKYWTRCLGIGKKHMYGSVCVIQKVILEEIKLVGK